MKCTVSFFYRVRLKKLQLLRNGLIFRYKILLMCVEMAKPEIQSMIFADRKSVTQRDNVRAFLQFLHLIKVYYQPDTVIIVDVIDYVLCCVLSNELLIKIILLLLP